MEEQQHQAARDEPTRIDISYRMSGCMRHESVQLMETIMFHSNLSTTDRVLRVVIGIVLIAVALLMPDVRIPDRSSTDTDSFYERCF